MPKPPVEPAKHPRTRNERDLAKRNGQITGYMTLPVGRPPKKPKNVHEEQETIVPATLSTLLSTSKNARGKYVNWSLPQNTAILQKYVDALMQDGDTNIITVDLEGQVPPLSTIRRVAQDLKDLEKQHGVALTVAEYFEHKAQNTNKNKLTLSVPHRKRLLQVIQTRDAKNDGMTRKEVLNVIQDISGCSQKAADNHLCYLVKNKKLPELKRSGQVVKAQQTTTSRSQVHIEQQLRFHTVIEAVLSDLDRMNQPFEDFQKVKEHFVTNLDETGIQGKY